MNRRLSGIVAVTVVILAAIFWLVGRGRGGGSPSTSERNESIVIVARPPEPSEKLSPPEHEVLPSAERIPVVKPIAGTALYGTVVDAKSGSPVPGANIKARPPYREGTDRIAATGSDGRYELPLVPGRYEVYIDHPSKYCADIRGPNDCFRIVVTEGERKRLDIVLHTARIISGRLKTTYGTAVTGTAEMFMLQNVTEGGIATKTDPVTGMEYDGTGPYIELEADGGYRYLVTHPKSGPFELTARVFDCAEVSMSVNLSPEEDVSGVDFVLGDGATVLGHVQNERGFPIPGVGIFLYPVGSSSAVSDDSGDFSIRGVRPGVYRFKIDPESLLANEDELIRDETIPEVPVYRMEPIVLNLKQSLRGRVVDARGNPLRAVVSFHTSRTSGSQIACSDQATGLFEMRGIDEVDFRSSGVFLNVRAEGYGTVEKAILDSAAISGFHEFILETAGTLRVKGPPDCVVSLRRVGETVEPKDYVVGGISEAGEGTLRDLAPGQYEVFLFHFPRTDQLEPPVDQQRVSIVGGESVRIEFENR